MALRPRFGFPSASSCAPGSALTSLLLGTTSFFTGTGGLELFLLAALELTLEELEGVEPDAGKAFDLAPACIGLKSDFALL